MNDLMSTREFAELAGVGPSAVKRWADAGRLDCVRTAGGHRRFRRAEVERFLRGAAEGAGNGRADPWIAALLGARGGLGLEPLLLSERSRTGAWHRVAEEAGVALVSLGERWEAGEVSILEEHLASDRLVRALARVGEAIPVGGDAPRALLAVAEAEEHTLGLALAELVLREAGWTTLWAGRSSPTKELAATVQRGGMHLLAVAASETSADALALRRQAEELGRACRVAGVPLLLGGGGPWPERPRHGLRLRAFEPLHRWAVAERERLSSGSSA